MPRLESIDPAGLGGPHLAYSQGVRAGELLFVAGQVALDPQGAAIAPVDVGEQTRISLRRVAAVLQEAGADLGQIALATVYLTDSADFPAFDSAWREVLGDHRPARATVRADLMLPGLLVEVQAIAVIPRVAE
jgi:2-iminobutanoate/2-iminopropanoate deaminase